MNIVMLQSSPHKHGSSNLLAAEFARGARESGHQVEIVDVGHLRIAPCRGCDKCGMDGPCIHKDDNAKVREALLSCDLAVFVTPVYYFTVSAQLKACIDRFYSYTYRLSSRKLKTVLICAAWDSDADVMPCIRDYYQKLCRYMHFQDQGMILGTGCGTPAMTERSEHIQSAYQLGRSLQG